MDRVVDGLTVSPPLICTRLLLIPYVATVTTAVMIAAMSTVPNPSLVMVGRGPPGPCHIIPGLPHLPLPPPLPQLHSLLLPLSAPIVGLASGSSTCLVPGMICDRKYTSIFPQEIYCIQLIRTMQYLIEYSNHVGPN